MFLNSRKVKLLPSSKNHHHLEVWDEEKCVKIIDKRLYKKELYKISHDDSVADCWENLEKKVALRYTLFLLNRKAYSSYELKKKLEERLVSKQVVVEVLSIVGDFLNDEALGESIVRVEKRQGKGERIIQHKLTRRLGWSHDVAAQFITAHLSIEEQLAEAKKRLARRFCAPLSMKDKAKALRYLLQRGYTYDTARMAIKNDL